MVYQLVFADSTTTLVIAVSYFQNRTGFLTFHSHFTTVAIIHTVAWLSQIVLGWALAIADLRIQYHITSDSINSITVTPSASDTAGIGLLAVVVAAAFAAVAGIVVMGFGCYLA